MSNTIRVMRRLASDESGQAAVEYLILLSAIAVGATALSRGVVKMLDQAILVIGANLEKDLKTGRAAVGIWKD